MDIQYCYSCNYCVLYPVGRARTSISGISSTMSAVVWLVDYSTGTVVCDQPNNTVGPTTDRRPAWNKCRLNHCLECIRVYRFFMKLFRTNNIETVRVSQFFSGTSLPSVVLRSRTDKFEQKFSLCADLVKALVWAAIILPCCLCFYDFLFMCYHYVWWIKLNI